MTQAQASAGVPVIKITKEDSSINFNVKASVAIDGTFDKWDATITMTSPDVESGVLDIKIQAASVNTGSGMKDGRLPYQGKGDQAPARSRGRWPSTVKTTG
jgi:polyisoprenoid-binding protein YceI